MKSQTNKPGPKKLSPYTEEVEQRMKDTYNRQSEKGKRLYSAIEALKLPHGGINYISTLFNCSRNTVTKGVNELKHPQLIIEINDRKNGGGRKPAIDTIDNIDAVFLKVIDDYIAGDPMNEDIRWTNLSKQKISERMKAEGVDISKTVVNKLLIKHKFTKRKALKKKAIGSSSYRNEQFGNIAMLKKQYIESGNPIVSVDTKKKNS